MFTTRVMTLQRKNKQKSHFVYEMKFRGKKIKDTCMSDCCKKKSISFLKPGTNYNNTF